MRDFITDMLQSCLVIAMLAIFVGVAYQDQIWPPPAKTAAPVFRPYNAHWQKRNDDKMVYCYQKMATIPEVKSCMFKLGAFI